MNADMEKELDLWNKERIAQKDMIRRQWSKTHGESHGRDGGPTRQLKELEDRCFEKYKTIIQKYEAKEGK